MQKAKTSFWKLVFLALALTLFFVFAVFFLIWLRLDSEQAHLLQHLAYDHAYHLLVLITTVPVALWVIFEICYTRFYLPLKKIPAEVSVIYRTNPAHRLEIPGNHNIKELSEAINDFARRYQYLNDHIAQEVDAARSETEKERNLLAAIMAELPVGIIICNSSGRILLSNSQAKTLFARNKAMERPEYFLGLGRSIFHLIDKSLISQALEEIEERLASGKKRVTSYFVTHIEEDTLILVETIPVVSQEQLVTGFILSLQDISGTMVRYDTIQQNLLSLDQGIRTQLSRIQELLGDEKQLAPTARHQLQQCFGAINTSYDAASAAILEAAFESMPLGRHNLEHFLFLIQKTAGYEKNIRVNITAARNETRIIGDTCSFVAAFVFILDNLVTLTALDEFDLEVTTAGKEVVFDLSWDGSPLDCAEIDRFVDLKITSLTCLGYFLKLNKASFQTFAGMGRNCSQIRITAKAELSLPFPGKRRSPVIAGSRPEFYDFNLFDIDDENQDLLNCTLTSLTYSVIDTETTGLDPGGGDEILAIAAVRIVRNRIAYDDCFEQLVNPGRDIPFQSFKIHGIDPSMVVDKPTIETVLPAFQRYLSETVIMGHDVAFDMKMFKMKEQRTGIAFNNPVLDTLLLSAMLHPVHKQHDLESIAKRLGVTIVGRHTAMGDAVAAAEIFLKLIPILQSKGIITLEDAIQASRRTYLKRSRY